MAENNNKIEIKKLKLSNDEDFDEEEFINSDKVVSIVNLLTKYKIKLWEIPSIAEIEMSRKLESIDTTLEELLMKLSDESGIVESEVKEMLIRLQKHSIKKFESNKRYSKEGLAMFSLKLIGNNNNLYPKTFKEDIEVMINITGKEFKELIINKFKLDCDKLKLIYNGKVVKDDLLLSSQDIKNNSTIMAMCVYEKLANEIVTKNSEDYKLISDIKEAVNLLSDGSLDLMDQSSNQFKLQNQNGLLIDVSKDDQRFLTSAMILHEKGKKLIRSKEYLKALILLAEADNEFKNCRDQNLLQRVDNYALLSLDIVWCYLCLQNLHDLRNAEERINSCEKCLEKCYGADLERLILLQGNANKYTPIFVRLNLLKAILNYHKGKKKECKQFLDVASQQLQKNTVDEEKLIQVMSMGFTSTQARLALRFTGGNIDAAIEQIIKKREVEKKSAKLNEEREYAKKLENKYGRTIKDALPIDIKTLKDIIQFGYSENEAAKALIQANNDFNLALDILQSQVNDNEPENTSTASASAISSKNEISDELINQLSSMGYEIELSKLCLEAFNLNIQKSIDYLLSKQNLFTTPNGLTMLEHELRHLVEHNKNLNKLNDTTSTTASTSKATNDEKVDNFKRKIEAKALLDDLAKDMPEDGEEYLDFNLDDDLLYINKYYSLLGI